MARLAAYQREFGADWQLWTGTPSAVAAFWKPFGVGYQIVPEEKPAHLDWWTGTPLTYDVVHTDGYILVDTDGRERFVDASAPDLGGRLSPKLSALLDGDGLHGLHHPQLRRVDRRRRALVHQLAPRHAASPRPLNPGGTAPFRPRPPGSPRHCRPCRVPPAASSGVTTLSVPPTTDVSLTLTVQRSPVGPILATGGGDTLYDFGPDTDRSSACVNDGCVFQWPPLTESGPIRVGKGVDPSLVGTIRRPDGSTQITYGGHPLYTYNLDVTPGMVTGQAIDQDGGPWYVLDASGHQVTKSFSVSTGSGIPNPKS